MIETIHELIDAEGTNGWKAEQCLRLLLDLPSADLPSVSAITAVAQVYATLAIAESIDIRQL